MSGGDQQFDGLVDAGNACLAAARCRTGITAKTASAAARIEIGAAVNSTLSTWAGVYSSLKMNFTPSASGWPRPNMRILVSGMPTRLGPSRSCTQAAIHRSSSTK